MAPPHAVDETAPMTPEVWNAIVRWQQERNDLESRILQTLVLQTKPRCRRHTWVDGEFDWGPPWGLRMVRICTVCGHTEGRVR
jgi:hypothetical protein